MYLNTHSYYSLRYGTLSVEQLVGAAKEKGVEAMALTDINNTSISFRFIRCCEKQGIKPILGIEYRNAGKLLYVVLARNNEGFYELNQLLTRCSFNEDLLPEIAPPFHHCYVIYTQLVKPIEDFREYEYLGIRPEQVNGPK